MSAAQPNDQSRAVSDRSTRPTTCSTTIETPTPTAQRRRSVTSVSPRRNENSAPSPSTTSTASAEGISPCAPTARGISPATTTSSSPSSSTTAPAAMPARALRSGPGQGAQRRAHEGPSCGRSQRVPGARGAIAAGPVVVIFVAAFGATGPPEPGAAESGAGPGDPLAGVRGGRADSAPVAPACANISGSSRRTSGECGW